VIVVQGRYNVLDKRRPQFNLDYPLGTTLIASLDQSIVAVARMRNAPVMRVIPQKSQYSHYRALMLSKPFVAILIPSIDKTQYTTVLLQNFDDEAPSCSFEGQICINSLS